MTFWESRPAELRVRRGSFSTMHVRRPAWHLMSIVAAVLLAPQVAGAAACHDEADRLAGRHALDAAQPAAEKQADKPIDNQADASPTRMQAQQLLSAARKADDDGIVEECLRHLTQARELIESGPSGR
jgi:hypothetical protein